VSQAVISGGRPARKRRSARPGSLTVVSGLGLGVALVWFSLLVHIPLVRCRSN
jgi:sulfate/thiosulfate transport system permease protein